MRHRLALLPALAAFLACAGAAHAHGLLIPEEKTVPPLAMLNHKVTIAIEDQVSVTRVEQTFRNHTDRNLEATYVFPVPKGASVNKFTMWVEGKETKGELLDAAEAKRIYTKIVRQTQDPGLLEYIGNEMLRMSVFPIPAHSDQRVAVSFTAVAQKDGNLIEYIYPLKTDGKATATLEGFSVQATIKSQHPITNVYSPTHSISLKRVSDTEVDVQFDKNQAQLDKDFQLFYSTSDKDVGITALTHRPVSAEPGYYTLLISPRVEIPKERQVPRDMVFVLDTSGSMRGVKMEQARNALKYCLNNLGSKDRFALINFATSVNKYRDNLLEASNEQVARARKWVDDLEATGGTAINDALAAALDYRTKDEGRTFTMVFFTDGQPTIGETDVEKILKNTFARNTGNTRIFTFGVGDDVNATMLDRLAEGTRALATYVRPAEDIEAKVSGLYAKISNPILTDLKVVTTGDVSLRDVYPAQLPDLFHGGQIVVLGRYTGKGPSAIRLTGKVGMEEKEFVYELTFPEKTKDEREFVEHLWARRKVGFLLDQIRVKGEVKELKDEVIALARRYGITTPYTSWLIVPDGTVPVAAPGRGARVPDVRLNPTGPTTSNSPAPAAVPPALYLNTTGSGTADKPGTPATVESFARGVNSDPSSLGENRTKYEQKRYTEEPKDANEKDRVKSLKEAEKQLHNQQLAREALAKGKQDEVQTGGLGVDLSLQTDNLRNQSRLTNTANRLVQGRNVIELGGVWIDEGFTAKTKTLTVKAQSEAYFRILELQPQVKDVYRLGNHLLWMTPSGTALVVDTRDGKEKLDDETINDLFKPAK
jgi:Ca-activated chloride channel family protein